MNSPVLLNLGYGNLVVASRVVAIVSPQSAPMKRLRDEASSRGKLVDATQGRRTRSIVVTDSDHVILPAINPDPIAARFRLACERLGLDKGERFQLDATRFRVPPGRGDQLSLFGSDP